VSPVPDVPLSQLRARADSLRGEASLRRLARRLSRDRRSGARALAERCARRAAAVAREQRRVRSLYALRRELGARGVKRAAGVDEVGVGPLAGPVVAAAVILCDEPDLPGLADSKQLSRAQREEIEPRIREQARAVAVAEVWPEDIDRMNIYQASLLAMRRAVLALGEPPDHLLVDARTIPDVAVPQTPLVGGDARDGSIAAASIVAKVHRDAQMRRLDVEHPGYGFARHKGYATPEHLAALRRLGPCPLHRRTFAPVAQRELF